ncbi:MAG TPA: SRPBCC domain-containing protein [Candidatus Nanopelagicales bacterium]|nr:SRPBCC domain-containing protein [Candidatus Nanopelagicales bacterium]
MEQGTIEREIRIDATPEVVFDVISSPQHIRGWWNGAQTDVEPRSGATAPITWDGGAEHDPVEQMTVVDASPYSLFSFRWVYGPETVATPTNSLLVVFELVPDGAGTVLRMTESGFRERGWDDAVAQGCYDDHVEGWDRFVPSIRDYTEALVAA